MSLCLSAGADGVGRLWDLDRPSAGPVRELKGQHRGAITCVAFSPDGGVCATGGEDRAICLWDTATGTLRYRLPPGHRGSVTSVQFTPGSRLVSAGRDNALRLWQLGEANAVLEATFDRRSGEVTRPGVSPDGRWVLFDQDQTLRLLSLPEGLTEAVLQSPSEAANFTAFALFSPDRRLIATPGPGEGGLRLWRTPADRTRGYEVRQLVFPAHCRATCAAFAPDGSFIAAGTQDRQVLVWATPPPEELDRPLVAEVTRIDRAVESNSRQVRIWAELPNPAGLLLPGTTVTLAVYPDGDRP
jgi:WD40 repeat protein